MIFRDREEAARQIARRLERLRGERPLVLAVPRGAVPMGRVVAEALGGDLDVVLVHKIGAPGNPELAVGAVDETGAVAILPEAEGYVDPLWVRQAATRELATLRERRRRYTPGRGSTDVAGRTVIVVDDGVATGATLEAALRLVRAQRPGRLIAAVGVAPASALPGLRGAADDVVCLATPSPFFAVGAFFDDFRQVSDEEVEAVLGAGATTEARP